VYQRVVEPLLPSNSITRLLRTGAILGSLRTTRKGPETDEVLGGIDVGCWIADLIWEIADYVLP
jgi:hypothetical protein